jgi:hypothetical protein
MIRITCREAAALLSRSHQEPIGLRRLSLAVHLAICGNCRTYSRQLDWIDAALQHAFGDEQEGLEAAARARIAAGLRSATDDEPPAPNAS